MNKPLFSIDEALDEIDYAADKYDRDYNTADTIQDENARISEFDSADCEWRASVLNTLEKLVESVKAAQALKNND